MSKNKMILEEIILPNCGIDTHAHLDFDDFSKDLEDVIVRANKVGVKYIVNVFLNPHEYENKRVLFDKFNNIYFALGIHPHEANLVNRDAIDLMKKIFAKDLKLRAVGEIGLDYYRNYCEKDVQINAFKMQLELAKELDYPVVIHCRDAEEDVFSILEDMGFKDYPLLWHCFTKDFSIAEKILNNGWMISIPGPVTFSKNKVLHRAVSQIPLSKLVVETDAPFLTPTPHRGKRNEPAYVVFTAKKIAEIKRQNIEKVWEELSKNGKNFYDIE